VTDVEQAPADVEQAPARILPAEEASWRVHERLLVRRYGLQAGTVAMALVIWVILAVGAPEVWLHNTIYSALMSTVPWETGLVALALTLVVIAREIDLSFGSVMAVGAWVAIATGQGELGLIAALAAGLAIGLLNGVLVVRFGIPSLVATIGTMFLWGGIVVLGTNATGASTTVVNGFVTTLLTGRIGGYVPAEAVWMAGLAVFFWVLLNRSRFGAHVYLVGDNEQSARMMGVRTDRVRMAIFALVGLMAALAGIVYMIEANYFWPTEGGGVLLPTIATVFVGGTSMLGGRGTIFGSFVAAYVIGAIEPGITSLNLTGYWTQVIYGAVIVAALVVQGLVMRRAQSTGARESIFRGVLGHIRSYEPDKGRAE
jgi:simple sugar transport system permease protein